ASVAEVGIGRGLEGADAPREGAQRALLEAAEPIRLLREDGLERVGDDAGTERSVELRGADEGQVGEADGGVHRGFDGVPGPSLVTERRALPAPPREVGDGGLEPLFERVMARHDVARPDEEERRGGDEDHEDGEPDGPESPLFALLHAPTTSRSSSWMRPLLASPAPPWIVSFPFMSVKRPPASRTS